MEGVVTLKCRFLIPKRCAFKGVYVIVNVNNKKCYVGSSQNIQTRIYQHMSQLRNHKSPVVEMQQDYDKGHNFIFHVVLKYHDVYKEKHKNKKDLLALELKTMQAYDAVNKGYNKDDLLGMSTYETDIFYSRIYTGELIEYVNGDGEKPYICLWSGYDEEHKQAD